MMCLIRTGVLSRGLARHLDSHRHDPARVHGAEPGGRGDQDVAAEEPDPAPSADARPQERDYDARPRRPATCWARITQWSRAPRGGVSMRAAKSTDAKDPTPRCRAASHTVKVLDPTSPSTAHPSIGSALSGSLPDDDGP